MTHLLMIYYWSSCDYKGLAVDDFGCADKGTDSRTTLAVAILDLMNGQGCDRMRYARNFALLCLAIK